MGIGSAIGAIGGIIGGRSENLKSKDAQGKAQMESWKQEIAMGNQWEYSKGMMEDYIKNAQGSADYINNNNLDWGNNNNGLEGSYEAQMAGMGGGAQGGDTGGIAAAQDMLAQWENSFGGIESNLSDYYSNLDPTKFAMQSKSQLTEAMDKQMGQFNDTMAASGLQSAGMKQQAMKEASFELAKGNAAIDINSPEQVAQMQQGFLQMGSQAKLQAQGLVGSAYAQDASLNNQTSIANMNSRDAMSRFNAGVANQEGMYNLDRQDRRYEYNQTNDNRNNMYKNQALINAQQRQGDAYRVGSGLIDPRTGLYGQNADRYGQSAVGHSAASGTYYGGAMKLGMDAANSYQGGN